jgi:hypothetical protein
MIGLLGPKAVKDDAPNARQRLRGVWHEDAITG